MRISLPLLAISRRKHFVIGLSVCARVRDHVQKVVNTISYKMLGNFTKDELIRFRVKKVRSQSDNERGLAARKLSVRLSVCLSVKRVICDKTEKSSGQIFIPHLPEILRQTVPVGAKSPIFSRYSLVAP